jgi:hypothetical protein
MKDGSCYRDAFQSLRRPAAALLSEVTACEPELVHGIPTLTGGEHAGRRFCHAWVEVGELVLAVADAVPRELYYEVGKIDPAECVRYTWREAVEKALESGTYGPWTELPVGVLFSSRGEIKEVPQ